MLRRLRLKFILTNMLLVTVVLLVLSLRHLHGAQGEGGPPPG